MARKQKVRSTIVRKGRRIYGHIFHFANRDIYLASRKLDQIFRSGEKTNSDAVRNDVACWAIDEETLGEMRLMGIRYVGVKVRQNNDIYVTCIDNFFNRKLAKFLDYGRRGGGQQRYLPLQHFSYKPGRVKIR
jgi:hypothetical protein